MEDKSAGKPDNKTVATPSDNASSATEAGQAGQSDQPGLKAKKPRRGSQARSGASERHRARSSTDNSSKIDQPPSSDSGLNSSGSVARPAAPSPTSDKPLDRSGQLPPPEDVKPLDAPATPAPKDQPQNK
jgi:hypothetical protein